MDVINSDVRRHYEFEQLSKNRVFRSRYTSIQWPNLTERQNEAYSKASCFRSRGGGEDMAHVGLAC